jgi:hypothetical protein
MFEYSSVSPEDQERIERATERILAEQKGEAFWEVFRAANPQIPESFYENLKLSPPGPTNEGIH